MAASEPPVVRAARDQRQRDEDDGAGGGDSHDATAYEAGWLSNGLRGRPGTDRGEAPVDLS
jgi:hypothetical protein